MTRTRWWLVLLLASVVVAAACSPAEPGADATTTSVTSTTAATTTTTVPPVTRGGDLTVRWGISAPIETINPFVLSGLVADSLDHLWRPRAVEWDERGRVVPDVVMSVPTSANDGVTFGEDGAMVVRYVIREEAVWADGAPITGDDFAFTHDVLKTTHPVHGKVTRLEVDGRTVVVEFPAFEPDYLQLFSGILPRHDLEGRDPVADFEGVSGETLWVSGGPFILDEIDDEGAFRFVRNDAYWKVDDLTGSSLPLLDSVTFSLPGIDTLFVTAEDLAAGIEEEIDFQFVGPADLLEVQQLAGSAPDHELLVTETGLLEHLAFQFGAIGTETNPDSLVHVADFRRAIAYAFDPGAITAAAYGDLVAPINGVISLASPSLSLEPWVVYEQDVRRSEDLVAQVCAEDERDCVEEPPVIHLTASDSEATRAMLEAMATMLDEVGIGTEVELVSGSPFTFLGPGTFDAGMFSFGFGPGLGSLLSNTAWFDPDCNAYRWGTPESGACDWDNPGGTRVTGAAVDRYRNIIEELETVGADAEQTAALALEAEAILADEMVVMPLHVRPDPVLLRVGLVGYLGTSVAEHFWNIEEWGFEG